MSRSIRLRLVTSVALALASGSLAGGVTLPALRFYAPFDGDTKPAFAAGSDALLPSGRAEFSAGHRGQAMRPLPETEGYRKLMGGGVQYRGEGNLDFDRGSVAFWWRTDFESGDRSVPSRLPGRMPIQALVSNHGPFHVFEYYDELQFFLGGTLSCKGAIPGWHKGEWHFIVATWDFGDGLRVYADGALIATTKAAWPHYAPPESFRLGLQKDAYNIDGLLDEFMIFDGPLTAEQVVALMNDKLPLTHAAKYRPPVAPVVPAAGTDEVEAKPVLHFAFDGADRIAPAVSNHVDLVAGLAGQAVRTYADSRLALPMAGALDARQGAISFWFRPQSQFAEDVQTRFLVGAGEPNAPLAVWQDIYRSGVIYQFRVSGGQSILEGKGTRAGEWYFVTLNWRDGQLAAFSADGRYERQAPSVEGGSLTNTPNLDTLWLGSAGGKNATEATFDELTIWDRPLTRRQVVAEVERRKPLRMFITQKVQKAGRPLRPTACFYNRLADTLPLDGLCEVIDSAGKPVATGRLSKRKIRGQRWLPVEIETGLAATPGTWIVRYHPGRGLADLSDYVYVPESEPSPTPLDSGLGTLVDELDCGAKIAPSQVVTDAFCRVVDSPLGRYLETGEPRLSRFALRLNVKHPETLHYLSLEVPDDKERVCLINNVRWRDNLTTGYLTGGEYRPSGALQEFVVPVYPHEKDLMFTLMNQQAGKPCAAKRVRLYEAPGPMPAATPSLPNGLPQRLIGEHYEQTEIETYFADTPNWGMYALEPEHVYRAWDRYTSFLAGTGQNLVDLPFGWYGGVSYPSASEEFALDGWGRDAVSYLMDLAARRGLKVIPQLTLRQAYPLMLAAREFRGPACDNPILQVAWDGTALAEPQWGAPMFNPLHPEVQRAFREQIEELMIHYGREPALGGVALVGSGWASTWFVDLTRDYGDYTVSLFEKETGIHVPTATGKQRFAVRFQFLADDAHREAWVAWRCRKIKEFYDSLGAVIRRHRPELKLYASVYPVPDGDAEEVILHGASLKEKYRQAGIDPDLFRNDPDAVVRFEYCIDTIPAERAGPNFSPIPKLPLNDLTYLPEGYSSLAAGKERAFTLHRLYFENYAGWRECRDAPELPGLWLTDRMKLAPWQSVLFHTPAALGRNFLKQLALNMANHDPFMVEHGGIWPMVGHEREMREFAAAYLALPAVRFDDFAGMEDPVRLRFRQVGGRFYFYLVNREPYPVAVELKLQHPLADEPVGAFRLEAYQLRSFAAAGANRILSARVIVPEPEQAALRARIAKLKDCLALDRDTDPEHARAAATVNRLEREFEQGHYSLTRFLAEGAIAARLVNRASPPRN